MVSVTTFEEAQYNVKFSITHDAYKGLISREKNKTSLLCSRLNRIFAIESNTYRLNQRVFDQSTRTTDHTDINPRGLAESMTANSKMPNGTNYEHLAAMEQWSSKDFVATISSPTIEITASRNRKFFVHGYILKKLGSPALAKVVNGL